VQQTGVDPDSPAGTHFVVRPLGKDEARFDLAAPQTVVRTWGTSYKRQPSIQAPLGEVLHVGNRETSIVPGLIVLMA
jgi:hypothetical protein